MTTIRTEHQLKRIYDPGFCYLCGESWSPDDETDDDHVLPTNGFLPEDRKQPLILRTHKVCHEPKGNYDVRVGQIFKILHGTMPSNFGDYKLELTKWTDPSTGEEVGGITDFEFTRILIGWLKGFHTALYREYLPHNGRRFAYTSPWPSFLGDPNHVEPIQAVHEKWVETLVASRMARMIDGIAVRNGKVRYECTWDRLDNGQPVCVFALDIYDWTRLSPPHAGPKRTCTGIYHAAKIPKTASRATSLIIPGRLRNPYDAFGEL